jgi:hypothetical protein
MSQYQVGQIVNGWQWNGSGWVQPSQAAPPPPPATSAAPMSMHMPQAQQQSAPMGMAMMQPQATGAPAPSFFRPAAEEAAKFSLLAQQEAARIATQKGGGGGSNLFFRALGPNGETNWEKVAPGYVAKYRIRLLPPLTPGLPVAKEQTHFYKSKEHPGGASIVCVGDDCEICIARNILFKSGQAALVERVKNIGKKQQKHIGQILVLDYPQSHQQQDGSMRPLLFRLNGELFSDLNKEAGAVDATNGTNTGIFRIVDLEVGYNLLYTKTKTGTGAMDVESSLSRLDSGPIPEAWHQVLVKPHDIHTFITPPSAAEIYQALNEMQLPITPDAQARLAARSQQEAMEAAQAAAKLGMDPSQMMQPQMQAMGQGALMNPQQQAMQQMMQQQMMQQQLMAGAPMGQPGMQMGAQPPWPQPNMQPQFPPQQMQQPQFPQQGTMPQGWQQPPQQQPQTMNPMQGQPFPWPPPKQ